MAGAFDSLDCAKVESKLIVLTHLAFLGLKDVHQSGLVPVLLLPHLFRELCCTLGSNFIFC